MSQPILTSATEAIAISVEMLNERARRIAELEAEVMLLRKALTEIEQVVRGSFSPILKLHKVMRICGAAPAPKEGKG